MPDTDRLSRIHQDHPKDVQGMKKQLSVSAVCLWVCSLSPGTRAQACTSLLVTAGASADGSVIITYTCDGEFHPRLRYYPAADHDPAEPLEIRDWGGKLRGTIREVPHTYAVVGLMNEHQLTITESTAGGRPELVNPDGLLHYWDLMRLALQRARTARQAITVMTELAAEYGYRSEGESISIADPREAWILEIFGPGPSGQGAEWVALRVPDGYVACHANKARIGEFPLDDPENCVYSDNAVTFAVERGYYDPQSGAPFRFCEVYCPATPKSRRYADTRVWSFFRRIAPPQNFSPDYHRAVDGAKPYPLWIRPEKKLSLADVFSLMRDHFEGTDYDMRRGLDAGPHGTPNRWRPIHWTVNGVEHAWERPISTQQTGFTCVAQMRSWLPDPVGGVYWYGVDDTYTTCYVPFYCGIDTLPESYTTGGLGAFSWESAWWTFNFVANYANVRYSYMIEDIQAVQKELEGKLLALQPAVEKTAVALAESNPELMTRFLTDYSVSHAELVVKRWRRLGEHLLTKYNDGYIKDENGIPQERGYPDAWLHKVIGSRPWQFRLKENASDAPESRLVD